MLRLEAKTIPHKSQRYDTVGDYTTTPDGVVHFRVSELNDWRYEACILVHELVEQILCRSRNIAQSEIDSFDMAFEARRVPGDLSEPGDSPLSPYKSEHFFATTIERLLVAELGLDWSEYEYAINAL